MKTYALVIRAGDKTGVIHSAADLCKVWPAHPEDTSKWIYVPATSHDKTVPAKIERRNAGDRFYIVLDGVHEDELCVPLYQAMVDAAIAHHVFDDDEPSEDSENEQINMPPVFVRNRPEVMFTSYDPLQRVPRKKEAANPVIVVVTDQASLSGSTSANAGTCTININPMSEGRIIRGHSVTVVLINTRRRLNPKLVATIESALKTSNGPIINMQP